MKNIYVALFITFVVFIVSLAPSFALADSSHSDYKSYIFDDEYIESTLDVFYPASVEFDHQSGIRYSWGSGVGQVRQVWGRTQAWQEFGQYKMSSYTRAYFRNHFTGVIRQDSGRVYSVGSGPSYAESGWMVDEPGWVARTNYGR